MCHVEFPVIKGKKSHENNFRSQILKGCPVQPHFISGEHIISIRLRGDDTATKTPLLSNYKDHP